MYSFADFCFVCLIHTKNLINISFRDADGIAHEVKLKHVLPELANFHPKHQKYICTNCLNNLNVIYKFRQKCLQNFATLNKCIDQLKFKDGYKNLSVSLLNMKQQMIQETLNHNQTMRRQMILEKLNQTQTKSIEEVFVKGDVDDDEQNATNLEKPKNVLESSDEENSLQFEIVIKREPDENTEVNEIKTELDETEPIFEYVSVDNITGQTTLLPTNTTNSKLKCKICSAKFENLKSLRTHVKQSHENAGFVCEICNKKYMRKMHLQRHMKMHEGVQFECPVCLKKFSQKSNMDIHQKIHKDVRDFECEICKKKFLQKHHLQDHIRLHFGAKNFQCSFCFKTFTQKVNMIQHEKIHEGIRNYECSFCHKKYTQKSNLKTHLLVHNRKQSTDVT